MWQGTTDDGCVALADLLGWKVCACNNCLNAGSNSNESQGQLRDKFFDEILYPTKQNSAITPDSQFTVRETSTKSVQFMSNIQAG